jgi:Tfp pilus assembly protein PilV
MHGQRARADDGFSLVEVLIGALVSLLALAGLAQTLLATSASQGSSERSVTASQFAAQEIEKIQAMQWELVGLYTADGPSANVVVDGVSKPTVQLAGTPPATGYRPLPTRTTAVQGTTYTLTTEIVWDDSAVHPPVAPAGSRKRILVDVTWTSRGQTRRVTAASLRAWPPVQRGPSLFYLVTTTAGPTEQLIDEYGYPVSTMVNGVPVSSVTLTGVTNVDADDVDATWVGRTGATENVGLDDLAGLELAWTKLISAPTPAPPPVVGPSTTTPVLSPLPSDDWRFANGATSFQITASAVGYPDDTRTVSVTFLHDQVYVVPGSVSANRTFCKKSNFRTNSAVQVDYEVQGFQPADLATVSWVSGLSTGVLTPQHLDVTTRGTRQRVTLPVNTFLLGSTISFTITVNRTSALPVTGLVQLPVTFNVSIEPAC